MKRVAIVLGSSVVALAMAAGVAKAGLGKGNASPNPVAISLNGRHATGGLGSARNGTSSIEFINVQVHGTSPSFGKEAIFFFKRSGDGLQHACLTDEPDLVDLARGMPSDAYVDVHWDVNDNCTEVTVINGSDSPPKLL